MLNNKTAKQQKLILGSILNDLKASRHLLYLSSGSLDNSTMLLLFCWKRFLSYKSGKVVEIGECNFEELLPECAPLKIELQELQRQLSEDGTIHVGYKTINNYYDVLRKLLLVEYKKVSNLPKWFDCILFFVKLCFVVAAIYCGHLLYKSLIPKKPWHVTYYQGVELSGLKLAEVEEDHVSLSKLQFMPKGSEFSVRFQSCLKIPKDYYLKNGERNISDELNVKITLASDDGGRLKIDDKNLINDWNPHEYRSFSAFYIFKLGKSYKITLDYFDIGGVAALQLTGSRPIFTSEYLTAPNDAGECQ